MSVEFVIANPDKIGKQSRFLLTIKYQVNYVTN